MAAPESSAPRPTPEAEEIYRRWIQFLDDEFVRHGSPERRGEIVRDQLYQLYLGRPFSGKLNLKLTSELPGNVVSLSLDPQNVTLEAEHFAEVDRERFARRKPLLWFWQMFDRSPIGLNHWLGLRFRCMLARHIFEHLGTGVKIYHGVDLTYGSTIAAASPSAITRSSAPSHASFPCGTIRRTTTRSGFSPRSSARAPTSPPMPSSLRGKTSHPANRSASSPTIGSEADY
jgi:hypothetical protein